MKDTKTILTSKTWKPAIVILRMISKRWQMASGLIMAKVRSKFKVEHIFKSFKWSFLFFFDSFSHFLNFNDDFDVTISDAWKLFLNFNHLERNQQFLIKFHACIINVLNPLENVNDAMKYMSWMVSWNFHVNITKFTNDVRYKNQIDGTHFQLHNV